MPTMNHALSQGANARLRTLSGTAEASAVGERRLMSKREGRPRNEVRRALRRAQAPLGLSSGELLLLDALVFLTSAQDWEHGQPVVYARNRTIAEHVPYGERRITLYLRRLADRGIIGRRYSSNGKRWGVRCPDGRLAEARGIDLSPMIEQADDWLLAAAQHEDDLRRHRSLAREVTELRVHLRDALYGYEGCDIAGKVTEIRTDLDAIVPPELHNTRALTRLDDSFLQELKVRLLRLVDRLENVLDDYVRGREVKETTTSDAANDDLQTRRLTPTTSSSYPQKKEKPVRDGSQDKAKTGPVRVPRAKFNPNVLPRALPYFFDDFAWARPSSAHGFSTAVTAARLEIRVGDALWREAHGLVGNPTTVELIAAYVYERLRTPGPNGLQDPDAVGGYFRRCAERAAAGQLHLAASLYASAQRHAAAPAPPAPARDDAIGGNDTETDDLI